MKFSAASALAVLGLAAPSLAADCYGPARQGSVTTYQQTAAGVCNGGTYNSMYTACQQSCCVFTEAWFQGSSGQRSQCWNAFNNIIGQCVEGSGRNGGQWLWNFNGVTQNYFLQANWVCGLKRRAVEAAGIQGVTVNNGTFVAVDEAHEAVEAREFANFQS